VTDKVNVRAHVYAYTKTAHPAGTTTTPAASLCNLILYLPLLKLIRSHRNLCLGRRRPTPRQPSFGKGVRHSQPGLRTVCTRKA
jgi:hypothetical protein